MQNPLTLYCPWAYPPPILSYPMHALPLFYPTPCTLSPYSIPPMHTLPLFYPTHAHPPPVLSHPCTPFPCFIPTHVYPLLILSQPMHTLPLFYPSPCMPSTNSIPTHTCHPSILFYCIPAHACLGNFLSHTPWRYVSPLLSAYTVCHFRLCSYWVSSQFTFLGNLEHHFMTSECLLFSFTWTHHLNYT